MTGERRSGLFLIDKPVGPTSHDVVQRVRRGTGIRRVGHAGTLDPVATGLLPVFVGGSTRLIEYMAGHPKGYTATVQLGVRTDTDDREGTVVAHAPVPPMTADDIDAALTPFRGTIQQVPPTYSAIKVGGVAAHRAARRGAPLTVDARTVTISELRLLRWESPMVELAMTVTTGTYVRSIARDLGEALGCGAHVIAMRRTRIGPVGVEEAHPLAAVEEAFAEGRGWDLATSPARFLADWPQIILNPGQCVRIRNGQPVRAPLPDAPRHAGHALGLLPDGAPLAVLVPDASLPDGWRPIKVLVD